MALSWPGTLPTKPQMQGWKEIPGDTSISTKMAVGPPKKRNRSTMPLDAFKMTYKLTEAQRGYLLTFFQTTTASGATEFTWTHPITDASLTVQFVGGAEEPAIDIVPYGIDYLATITLKEVS